MRRSREINFSARGKVQMSRRGFDMRGEMLVSVDGGEELISDVEDDDKCALRFDRIAQPRDLAGI